MSNAFYQNAYDLAATTGLDWVAGDFLLVAVDLDDGSYVFSAADQFRDDLTGVITSASVTGMVTSPHPSGGTVGDAADITPGLLIPTGSTLSALVLCTDTGDAATDQLLFYWDQDALGNPFNRIGDDTTAGVVWNNGLDRVFSIVPLV